MSKKDKNAKRPSYLDYRGTPKGFKMYIHDMIVALRNEGNKHAKKFDLDGFMNVAPDEITPDSVADHPEIEPFIHEMMEHLAWDIFGDMLQKVGLTEEVIDRITSNGTGTLNTTGKHIPGLNKDSDDANKVKAHAIYEQILERVAQVIIEATSNNDPSVIDDIIATLTRVQNDTSHMLVSEEARENIQNLLDSTICFQELIDNEKTTPEEYDSFLNNMISEFIQDQITETNEGVVAGEHSNHDPDNCGLTTFDHEGPLKLVYRRLFTGKDDDFAIPNLHVLVLDTVNGVVHPIALSLHEALNPITSKRFQDDCRSEKGTAFIGSTVVNFIKTNEDLVKAMIRKHEIEDGKAQAAMLRVSPEIVAPTGNMMREVLDRTRKSFNVDANNEFSDIKPEDFFN